ncbi:uncharacterized protein Ecym_6484 [Eremothecium cymbalariae DBVPG|uniref:Globin domain-containing protein n=1 Tax=Eremothecium cymbalariae (strain CBS 270.75 / DBVPG 7215 / KCTC 17166 / NRRL Y-17582) TaxID=931890 RepID=G8JUS3_ERECY|nr:hypothetical protein Ecym_6484 [Eremothecium cymbalariae DBVPG\
MSNEPRSSLYNPLDRSQISFIPTELAPIQDSPGDSICGGSGDRYLDSSSLNRTTTNTTSTRTNNGNCNDESDRLTRLSTRQSLGSNIVDRMRYKIVLKLTSREIQLIRSSWATMLNETATSDKTVALFRQIERVPSNTTTIQQQQNSINNNTTQYLQRRPTSVTTNSAGQSSNNLSAVSVISPQASSISSTESFTSNNMASSLFCAQFYANLLDMDPELDKMYPSIKHQAVAYAGVLTTAISHLENLSLMDAYLNDLGKRHARILGIEPPHFELMGVAFLKTIQDRFGIHCTIELVETWSRLYSYLANSILQFGIDPILEIDRDRKQLIPSVSSLVKDTATKTAPYSQNGDAAQTEQGSAYSTGDVHIEVQQAQNGSQSPHNRETNLQIVPKSSYNPLTSSSSYENPQLTPESKLQKKIDPTHQSNGNKRPHFYKRRKNTNRDCVVM